MLNTAGRFSYKVFSVSPTPYEAEISLLLGVRFSRVLDRIFHLEPALESLIPTTTTLQRSIFTEHFVQLMEDTVKPTMSFLSQFHLLLEISCSSRLTNQFSLSKDR